MRSVLILHCNEGICTLEAVSTRTKKGLVKDPLLWNTKLNSFQDIAHYSRMRLYMTIAEAFAFQVLKCREMRL